MELTYFTVSNYRSITSAYKISLQNITILLGKNNVGKSNLIKALKLSMEIIRYARVLRVRRVPRNLYIWHDDFPVGLQNKRKLKNKDTEFRLDFKLDEKEISDFYEKVGSSINGDLSIYIKIKQDGILSITVPKKGKNAKALTKKIREISEFICDNIYIQYIPAIRSEENAYEVINNIVEEELSQTEDEEYQKAQNYIIEYRKQKLKELSGRIKKPLSVFMPSVKSVNLDIDERLSRTVVLPPKSLCVDIDDGVLTSLSQKGDGVKSLTTMAILSETTAKNRVIIVDEPEAHLHPEAIHYLKKVLFGMAENNQLIISTHNPIFVNRNIISSNIIVENGQTVSAKRVEEIRRVLGVKISDNLLYSDYVIVVEGPSDKLVMEYVIKQNSYLSSLLETNMITVRSLGGVNNLKNELYNLEQHMCNYIVILDNDGPAINKVNQTRNSIGIDNNKFKYFCLSQFRESELEDIYNTCIYKEYLKAKFQIDISVGSFKNKSKKWSKRIEELARATGSLLNDEQIDEIKKELSKTVCKYGLDKAFTSEGASLLKCIIERIELDVKVLFTIPGEK